MGYDIEKEKSSTAGCRASHLVQRIPEQQPGSVELAEGFSVMPNISNGS